MKILVIDDGYGCYNCGPTWHNHAERRSIDTHYVSPTSILPTKQPSTRLDPYSPHDASPPSLPASQPRKKPQFLLEDPEDGYGFIRQNPRTSKPRKTGVTEIRGPSDSAMGKRYLQDLLETMGCHVDGPKLGDGGYVWEGGDVSAGGGGWGGLGEK